MAEVTYYFDGGIEAWSDPTYMWDNILTNFAYTSTDDLVQLVKDNTCPGTDLGTITNVELRVYGYGDGNDQIILDPYGTAWGGNEHIITMPSSANWSDYVDITSDLLDSWSWALIVDLNSIVKFNKVGKGNTMYCAKVEIRVTYTEAGVKVTQYLAGKDCPAFPHEMDLQSDKLPCPLPH